MISKYCMNSSIIDWIRRLDKTHKNESIGWKSFVMSFPLIGDWMAWKVGDGKNIIIVVYPWIGAGNSYRIS